MVRRSLAVANGDVPTLGPWGTSVNAHFWCRCRAASLAQNSTPSEPPELRARTFDFPLWLKYAFSE
jgi:hypothetical protein